MPERKNKNSSKLKVGLWLKVRSIRWFPFKKLQLISLMLKSQTLGMTPQFSIRIHEQEPHFTQLIFMNKNKNNLQDNQPINPTLYIPKFWAKKKFCLSSDRHSI